MLDELTQRISHKVSGKDAFGFNLKIDLESTGTIFIAGSTPPITVSNDNGDADTTFIVSAENLAAMLSGNLAPMTAYMQGKLRVEGDLGKAMQIGSLFN